MTAWDECIQKLRLAEVACQNAQDKSDECLAECQDINTALAKVREGYDQLRIQLGGPGEN